MRPLLSSLLTALLLTAVAPLALEAAPAAPQREKPDERGWRDARRPDQRALWDALEGKPAPSLDVLSGWINTDGRS